MPTCNLYLLGISVGMKDDKPQPMKYHPKMDVFKTTLHMVQVKLKLLQVDVINEKINDCFEILIFIAQV